MTRRDLILTLVITILAVGGGWWAGEWLRTDAAETTVVCQLGEAPCVIRLGDWQGEVTLPAAPVYRKPFRLLLRGPDIPAITAWIEGEQMAMGVFPFREVARDASQLELEGTLPLCATGEGMRWRILLQVAATTTVMPPATVALGLAGVRSE